MRPARPLSRVLLTNLLLGTTLACVLLGCLWVGRETTRFNADVAVLRERMLDARKNQMREKVDSAVAYLEFMRSQTDARTRLVIRERAQEAHALATHLHSRYQATVSRPELEVIIREALRPIRFNEGRGYYYATRLDGVEQLCASCTELEGKNLLDLRDARDAPVIRDMIALIREKGEGFYTYTWSKPEAAGREHVKISYIKRFEPFDWFIGAGEYLKDIEGDLQREALNWIRSIRYDRDGFVFAGSWDGISLSGPAVGKNMLEVTDAGGKKIVREMIGISRIGSGFLEYAMPRFDGHRPAMKISYTRGVPAWQWYIGTGQYIDDIEQEIAAQRKAAMVSLGWNIATICFVLVLLWLGMYGLAIRMNTRTQGMVEVLLALFNRQAVDQDEIGLEPLTITEFRDLAGAANQMIARQREAERSLRESQQFLQTLIENSGASIFVKDREGVYQLVNQNFLEVAGLSREAVLGKTDEQLFPLDAEAFGRNFATVLHTGAMCKVEETLHAPDGERFFLGIQFPLFDGAGQVTGVCGMTTEITEIRQAQREKEHLQEKLVQAQKMESIGRLAGGVAHDFNNMLSVILGHAELALQEAKPDSKLHSSLRRIREAAERSADLTRQLLAFARKQTTAPRILDLSATVKGLLKMLRRLIGEGVELVWQPGRGPVPVRMDPSQIDQILVNLCINARDAIGGAGRVTIATTTQWLGESSSDTHPEARPGEYAVLVVSDNGCGMDADTLDHLFEPFFTTKAVGLGTGLGLATVYGIVQQNGGFITVASELGMGATLRIFSPRWQGEVEELGALAAESKVPEGNETILLVEDEPMILDLVRTMLADLGYRVLAAATPGEAIRLARGHAGELHLVVTDVVMPEMNGRDLAEGLLVLYPRLKAMFMSGYTADVIAHHGVLDKGMHFIQKPFTQAELALRVRQALDADRAIR